MPNLMAYDPAYAFELAVIVRDGMKRMYTNREDIFYYITLYNENYAMLPMPAGAEEGILKGLYKLKPGSDGGGERPRVHLVGSGSLMGGVLRAQGILAERYGVVADVWSATSYKELRRDALEADRWNLLHPDEEPRKPYVAQAFEGDDRPIVAVTDFMKMVPDMVSRWLPGRLFSLGTDGFGRSETREALRRFFEVDAECVVIAALHQLGLRGAVDRSVARRAIDELGIDPGKPDPLIS